jgi:tetraacyldisaccharide 4'-kinase
VNTVKAKFNHRISSWFQRTWYAPPLSSLPWPLWSLLSIGSRLYVRGLYLHQHYVRQSRCSLPAFVISVGNLVVGGTGKTPLTLWLANYLHSRGFSPAILSRGYKKRDAGIVRVPAGGVSLQEVLEFGDEPALMARKAKPVPVWVGKDRWRSGNLAIQTDGADVLILDDGFQHLALERDLDLVLLDAQNPFGNGAILPLGPLREPPTHLARADAFVLTRAQDTEKSMETRSNITQWFPGKPVFSCIHRLIALSAGIDGELIPFNALQGKKAVAFAGIARPESFFHLLRQGGVVLRRSYAFPDHHPYQNADMVMLAAALRESDAVFLITTEKDMCRLSPKFRAFTLAAVLEIDFLSDHEVFCDFLQERLPAR